MTKESNEFVYLEKKIFKIYMDDFILSNLHYSRDEWSSRLVNILTPLVIEGIRSIFSESWNMCVTNNEIDKYLMTFQNMLCRVPKWNSIIVEEERKRIIERIGSGKYRNPEERNAFRRDLLMKEKLHRDPVTIRGEVWQGFPS